MAAITRKRNWGNILSGISFSISMRYDTNMQDGVCHCPGYASTLDSNTVFMGNCSRPFQFQAAIINSLPSSNYLSVHKYCVEISLNAQNANVIYLQYQTLFLYKTLNNQALYLIILIYTYFYSKRKKQILQTLSNIFSFHTI